MTGLRLEGCLSGLYLNIPFGTVWAHFPEAPGLPGFLARHWLCGGRRAAGDLYGFPLMIMESILYRTITEQDYPQISEMLCGIWQFDKYLNDENTVRRAGLAFWYSYLARQNYAEAAERDGRILGILLGHCGSLPFPVEHKGFEKEAQRFLREFSRSGEGRKFYKAQTRTAKYEHQLLAPYEGRFDAELVLFATAPEARGMGVGKTLLSRFNAFLKEQEAQHAFLLTDSFCNFGFYDHLGYERLAEVEGLLGIEPDGKPLHFYLYGYEV